MTISELFSIKIKKPDKKIWEASKKKWDSIAKPIDGLGDFESIISGIAAIKGSVDFDLSDKALVIMCSDNGIVEEGVSQADQSVTRGVAALMGKRESSVGIMAKNYPVEILTVDVGINSDEEFEGVINKKVRKGTENFLKSPAMSDEECLQAIEAGIDVVKSCKERGIGIIATGEMGIGNTTTATAVLSALTGVAPRKIVGRGAGLTREGLKRKKEVIKAGIRLYRKSPAPRKARRKEDVFEALRRLGGLDIAGLVGVYIGCAMEGIPVVIDGLIGAVAGLAAEKLVKGSKAFMIASHKGREKGAELALKTLDLKPVIDADMARGEGSGALMVFPLLDMAMSLYLSGTTFSSTDISQYERYKR